MVINMTHIRINIDTPVVSVDEFVRRSGIPLPTVRKQISSGIIPILPRAKRNEKVNVNMIAYMVKCALAGGMDVTIASNK